MVYIRILTQMSKFYMATPERMIYFITFFVIRPKTPRTMLGCSRRQVRRMAALTANARPSRC